MTKLERRILNAIPGSWFDPLLTGPDAVIGNPPYSCKDIENLLLAIRRKIETLINPAQKAPMRAPSAKAVAYFKGAIAKRKRLKQKAKRKKK